MKLSLSCLVLASSLCAATAANATITSATVYVGTPDAINAGDSKNFTVGTGDATGSASFTIGAGGINFASPPAAYTVGAFLNNPTFSNITGNFSSTGTDNNTEVVITGSLGLKAGDVLTINHDDGVVLFLNGINEINSPGPTTDIPSSYTVTATGTYTFTLEYAEALGSPADLNFTDNGVTVTTTPEPSSLILLGTGLATAAGFARRRFSRGV